MTDTATVYICRDSDGHVLYVGKSLAAFGRVGAHRHTPWWPDVKTIELEHTTPELVDHLERDLIRGLRPDANKVHSPLRWSHL